MDGATRYRSAAIAAMLLSAWMVEGVLEVPHIAIRTVAIVLAVIVGLRLYQSATMAGLAATGPFPSGHAPGTVVGGPSHPAHGGISG